ncbi:MAG: flagellar basal-body rod protein FlgG [Candidatus Eisenbacteria bacterium]|uniref:Flagellar basal-body rod protein FlgG n=1 Tax=Eiseniibacteriota bacterium TaxID=2212470 RepID=A0A937XBY9_UNCEI|nr:flagellar basal-body rod protein FlgG [Candidatus Eisenbacteria bacterium]
MLRALRTAASGMSAQQLYIDVIAHNLANVNTTGYKKSRVDFEDLLYQTLRPAGNGEAGTQVPAGLQVGHGTTLVAAPKLFSQGDSEPTGNPLDLLITGDGLFQVEMPDGSVAYTRDGSLRIDGEGRLVTAQGYAVSPEITLPQDAEALLIAPDGRVTVRQAGAADASEVGQLLLARFVNPSGLESLGGNLLRQSPASGDPILGAPGEQGIGTLLQGALERSNVNVVEEMIAMIVAQRAFEINSKAVRTAEELLSIANDIKR